MAKIGGNKYIESEDIMFVDSKELTEVLTSSTTSHTRRQEFTNDIKNTDNFWSDYEKSLKSSECNFLNTFCDYSRATHSKFVEDKISSKTKSIISLQEEIKEDEKYLRSYEIGYLKLREDPDYSKSIGMTPLPKITLTRNETKKSGKQFKVKASVEICSKNAMKDLTDDLIGINSPTKDNGKNSLMGKNFIERGVCGTLRTLKNICEKCTDLKVIHDAWFGVGKLWDRLKNLDVRDAVTNNICKVHEQVLNDLLEGYTKFVSHFSDILSYDKISKDYAEFYYATSFDNILPGSTTKPYNSQKELISFVSQSVVNELPFIITYTTIMGMGKTTTVATLLEAVPNKTILYVCPEGLKAVREKVGSLIHYLDSYFGLVTVDILPNGTSKLIVKEQNKCKKSNKKPDILLCGIEACIEIFKSGNPIKYNKKVLVEKKMRDIEIVIDPNDIVIFFDEPTVTLDEPKSPMLHYLSELYSNMPPYVIFSSATHPAIEKIELLQKHFLKKYPNGIFKTIDSSFVKIGTQLNKMDGKMVILHNNCNTMEQLEEFINIVDSNLMYKKSYTFSLVSKMFDKIVELGIVDRLEQKNYFKFYMDNLSNRNQMAIGDLGITYLKFILEQSKTNPDIIKQFNSIDATNIPINYDNLVESAKVLNGQTFISCNDPYLEMMSKLGDYLKQVKEKIGFKSYSDLKTNYLLRVADDKKQTESMLKGQSKGLSKIEREKLEHSTSSISSNLIPASYGLNGSTHSISNIDVEVPDSQEYDNLLYMALLGIVVYRKDSHYSYHNMIIKLMNSGQCVFVFADSSLNYGNSFPFNNAIILSSMSTHSANTLLQLMARAGRPGLSAYAIIYAADSVIDKLLEPLYNPNYIDMEMLNIIKAIKLATIKKVIKDNKEYEKKYLESLKSDGDQLINLHEYFTNIEFGLIKIIEYLIYTLSPDEKDIIHQAIKECLIEPIELRYKFFISKFNSLLKIHHDNFKLIKHIQEINIVLKKFKSDCYKAKITFYDEQNKKNVSKLQSSLLSYENINHSIEKYILSEEFRLENLINFECLECSSEDILIIDDINKKVLEHSILSRSLRRIEYFKELLTIFTDKPKFTSIIINIIEYTKNHHKNICEIELMVRNKINQRILLAKKKLVELFDNFISNIIDFTSIAKIKINNEHEKFYVEYTKLKVKLELLIKQISDYGMEAESKEMFEYMNSIYTKTLIAKQRLMENKNINEFISEKVFLDKRQVENVSKVVKIIDSKPMGIESSWRKR